MHKNKLVFSLLILLFITTIPCSSLAQDCPYPEHAAEEIKNAVINSDTNKFLSHVDQGIWFIDDFYTHRQLAKLLKNKQSWLALDLFGPNKSMRDFLEKNTIKIVCLQEDQRVTTYYSSSEKNIPLMPSLTLMCIRGDWKITNINTFYPPDHLP